MLIVTDLDQMHVFLDPSFHVRVYEKVLALFLHHLHPLLSDLPHCAENRESHGVRHDIWVLRASVLVL